MTNVHKEYDGRKVRIPNPRPGWTNPYAGREGLLIWAGWDDWYTIHVPGNKEGEWIYFAREQAHTVKPYLIEETKDV